MTNNTFLQFDEDSLLFEYKKAVDYSNIVSKTDKFGNIIYVNELFCKVSWYSKEELIWKNHNILRHPDMSNDIFKNLWKTITQKKIWSWIIKNKRKDWWYYWVKSTIAPILSKETGEILEYISIRTDITELKDTQKAIEWYEEAMNTANFVFKLTHEWHIKFVNKKFLDYSGYKEKELLWLDFFWNKFSENIDLIIDNDSEGEFKLPFKEKVWKGVLKMKKKDNNFLYWKTTIVPVLNSNDTLNEYIIIQSDITQLKTAEQKLSDSYAQLKLLGEKKDEFLSIVSHDLRTPISVSQGYISLLTENVIWRIDDDAKDILLKISKTNVRLLTLINDLLDSSKLESWKYEFNFEDVNLNTILDDIFFEHNSLAMKKNITIILKKEKNEFIINTDINKLKQVFVNIVWNAIKFTKDYWKIEIWYKVNSDSYEIYIKDNGIWIPEDKKNIIFEKFWQVKNDYTKNIEGTWLWLSIVKIIMENLGWKIFVESKEGIGSIFWLKFPIINIK